MRSSIATLFSVLGFAAFATAKPMGVPGANVPATPGAPVAPDLNWAAIPGAPATSVPAVAAPALPDTPSLATLAAIFDAFHKGADAKMSELTAPETHLNIKTVEDDLKIIEDKLAEALAAVKKIESPVSIVAVSVGLSVRVTLPDVQADVARLCNGVSDMVSELRELADADAAAKESLDRIVPMVGDIIAAISELLPKGALEVVSTLIKTTVADNIVAWFGDVKARIIGITTAVTSKAPDAPVPAPAAPAATTPKAPTSPLHPARRAAHRRR